VGPKVLAEWCEREGLDRWSASTIAKVIADLRLPDEEPRPTRRVEVTRSGVMWSEDGTEFGRGRRKRELLVVQDECSRLKLNWKLARGKARETHAVENLEQAFREHGPPLVLKHDGDSIFHGERMRRLLAEWRVLDLTGPSYWPRYNGKKERSMRDIKSMERALGRHGVGDSLAERIDLAMQDLNEERPRPMLGGRTAREVFEAEKVGEVDRDELWKEVREETRRRRSQALSRCERQAARRHAVEMVLSRHGLLREMEGSVN
jgi:transposase InsO family protein